MSLSQYLWFTPEQENAILITERVTSAFSIAGCLFVVITFLTSKRFHKPINRLLFYATIGNLCMNGGTMMAFVGIYAGRNSYLCQIQGFLIQMFLPADAYWNFAMAYSTYLTVFKKYDARRLQSMEWIYNGVAYGLPFAVALAYCFIDTEARGKMYGPATIWCWVDSHWDIFRVALCYGPAWLAILGSFLIYVAAGISIYRKRNQLRRFRSSEKRPGGSSSLALQLFSSTINKTTEVRTTSEAREGGLVEKGDVAGQYHCSAEALPQDPFGDPLLQNTQNPAMQANAAAWGYTKAAILFFCSLMITWVPSSLFRVFSVVHPDIHVFGLAYAAAFVLPLQGFWNAIIYIITSHSAIKAWWTQDVLRRGGPSSPHPGWEEGSRLSRANTISNRKSVDSTKAPFLGRDSASNSSRPDAIHANASSPWLPPVTPNLPPGRGLHDPAVPARSASVRSMRNDATRFDPASLRAGRRGASNGRSQSATGWRQPSDGRAPSPFLARLTARRFEDAGAAGNGEVFELPGRTTPSGR